MNQELTRAIINAIRVILTISDIALFVCVGYFAQGLKWSKEEDRPSIIGFMWMLITIAASVVFLWI